MKSTKTNEEILEEAKSIPRPILIPSAVVGYFADLIIEVAKIKAEAVKVSTSKSKSTSTSTSKDH